MKDLQKRIGDWLASFEPGSRLLRVWPLSGGISSRMTAFRYSHRHGTRTLVLRQPNDWTLENRPDAVVKEFRRLQALHRGPVAVQTPCFCDATGSTFGRPGLVIEYIDGHPEFNPGNLMDYLRQFARHLSAIHLFKGSLTDLALTEGTMIGSDPLEDKRLAKTDPLFQVDRIYSALGAQGDRTSGNEPVLLHGDYWPGNTLWREGLLVAVIDWEEAARGDPLHDLSIARLDLFWAFGRSAMEAFTTCYQEINPIDLTLLPLWDLRAALRPASNLAGWVTSYDSMGRPDITLDHMKSTHVDFVAQAFEALGRV